MVVFDGASTKVINSNCRLFLVVLDWPRIYY